MDLSENRTNHPNLIVAADAGSCTIGQVIHRQSIIIPSHNPVTQATVHTVSELQHDTFLNLCDHDPELIILATGESIVFPEPDILEPLVKNHIGLEVLDNQAAARTFNVILAESRRVVCLMLIEP
ncbi:Mth938-like domain-containing protein [Marinicella sediminis]|uniref:Mth938-like domain-containing protein n=1 Tax=Marinicella sediminis TaxID=1792834 RepID=A0ABV7JBI3_9GAMM|nr:MTH938/NDUFAF3 family protein [Marinicella sediminis]